MRINKVVTFYIALSFTFHPTSELASKLRWLAQPLLNILSHFFHLVHEMTQGCHHNEKRNK